MKHYLLLLAAPALLLGAARPASTTRPLNTTAGAAPSAVLSNAARTALLSRAKLGRLWQHAPQAGTDDVLNGCFGYDGRRLEFVFLRVQPDPRSPGRYLVAGKFRCYGDVTPFRGSVEVQQVQRLPAAAAGTDDPAAAPVYCATGSFSLQATSAHGLGGRFDGRLALDFGLSSSGRAELAPYTANDLTRHGGLLFEGEWRDGPGGDPVPALWKQGVAVTRQVLQRFDLGERSPVVSPRYARVGWNTFWDNHEWWTARVVARR